MNKIIISILTILYLCTLNAYAVHMPRVSPEKQKEMRECIYNSYDTENVMQSVVSTLYDSDFTIEEYEPELGFIRATKTFKSHYVNKKRIAGWTTALAFATAYTVFSYGSTAASMYSPSKRIATEMKDKTIVADVNVYVEKIDDNQIKVKFIPVAKILQNADGFSFTSSAPVRVFRIYKPAVYNEFFNQLGQKLN